MIVLVTRDLMLMSQVRAAADQAGIDMASVMGVDDLKRHLDSGEVRGVFLDLGTDDVSPDEVASVAQVASSSPATIAFGSHVLTGLLDAARDAGFQHVLSRGQFVTGIDGILQGLPE